MFRRGLKLDELLQFNDLLATTVRGEAALVDSLRIASRGASGRTRRILECLCQDLEQGSDLSTALAAQPRYFCDHYCQVIRSGEQSRHLGPVLEGVSLFLGQLVQLRRGLGLALLYPILVLISAYLLFVLAGNMSVKSFVYFYETTPMPLTPLLVMLQGVFGSILYWVWILPLLLIVAWCSWFSNNSWDGVTGRSLGVLTLIPGFAAIVRLHRLANFTELVALLLNRSVPYAQAIQTAAQASGDPGLMLLAHHPETLLGSRRGLPPFLAWLLEHATGSSDVRLTMQHAAEMYRRRAETATVMMKLIAPVCFLVLIGGGATLFYAMTVFYPFTHMLQQL